MFNNFKNSFDSDASWIVAIENAPDGLDSFEALERGLAEPILSVVFVLFTKSDDGEGGPIDAVEVLFRHAASHDTAGICQDAVREARRREWKQPPAHGTRLLEVDEVPRRIRAPEGNRMS